MLDAKFSRNLVKEFRDRLFEKLLKIDVSKLQQKKNGDIMSYFVKDIQEVRKFISNTTTTTVRFFLNFLIVAIAMSKSTNIKLTLMVLLPIFISIILILLNLRKLSKHYEDSRIKFTDLSEFVQESTDSIRTTKAYCGENKQCEEFINKNSSLKNTNFNVIKRESLMSNYNTLGLGIGFGILVLVGSKMVLNGEMSIGDFVAFSGYMTILSSPIRWMPWIIKHFKKVQVSYKRLQEMFDMKEEKIKIDNSYEELKGEIEIKDLDFKFLQNKIVFVFIDKNSCFVVKIINILVVFISHKIAQKNCILHKVAIATKIFANKNFKFFLIKNNVHIFFYKTFAKN